MEAVLYIIAKVVQILLSVLSLAMFLRVILQFFTDEGNKLDTFCYAITEPFIVPIRMICDKMNVGQNSPVDVPFFITYIIITVLQLILPII